MTSQRVPDQDRKRHECAGCHQLIAPGLEIPVNVTSGKHIITVFAHEGHFDAAYANTMERSDWKRSDSFLSN